MRASVRAKANHAKVLVVNPLQLHAFVGVNEFACLRKPWLAIRIPLRVVKTEFLPIDTGIDESAQAHT